MARAIISPESQIQRLNNLKSEVEQLRKQPIDILIKKPSEKAWSTVEVVEHMVRGHIDYKEKLDNTVAKLKERSEPLETVKSRAMPSFLIKRFPPKDKKIRFKMKTMKRFNPIFSNGEMKEEKTDKVFIDFYDSLQHLRRTIDAYRKTDATAIIFNSAVGAWVKFNVPEAVEFIICHNERHLQQMKNTLKKVKK